MNIYFIRHGESKANFDNHNGKFYFCGQLDVPLTQEGVHSAEGLIPNFKDIDVNHVYVSDLTRAIQTYEHIFPYSVPTTYTPLLRERSLGVFEGKAQDELSKVTEYEKYFNDPKLKDFRNSYSIRVPEGESYQDVIDRFETFFKKEVNHNDDTIVIIAHKILIRCALVYLKQLTREESLKTHIENCKPYLVKL